MDLVDVLHGIVESSINAYGPTDMAVGTVTKASPLEVTIRDTMAPLPQEVLWLTASVIEKKIPVLEHAHITSGFRHSHAVDGLEHIHSSSDGDTGPALSGTASTSDGLVQDAFTSDKRLLEREIICYEDGKPLPVKDGYIILNRGLEVGDKVLLFRVMRGQQFIILSRIFERRGVSANSAKVSNRLF